MTLRNRAEKLTKNLRSSKQFHLFLSISFFVLRLRCKVRSFSLFFAVWEIGFFFRRENFVTTGCELGNQSWRKIPRLTSTGSNSRPMLPMANGTKRKSTFLGFLRLIRTKCHCRSSSTFVSWNILRQSTGEFFGIFPSNFWDLLLSWLWFSPEIGYRKDYSNAVKILNKDLKFFAVYNQNLFTELTLLLTLKNFRYLLNLCFFFFLGWKFLWFCVVWFGFL